ncbi:hypothetical protein OH77DRAFT_1525007 [Trametes cingulata]|nr:hypothetical protein OH77DRAFT_1525602 [Trametes cingulata]KAI0350311.1 hypothetical protein OH77DRAFT_1525007 [Trametes cingulata]
MPLPSPLFAIPVFTALPVPDRTDQPRHLLISVSVELVNGASLRAHAYWLETPPPLPSNTNPRHNTTNIGSTPPGVDVFLPPHILGQPLYIVLREHPDLHLPTPFLVAVLITEWSPGDPSSLELHVDMRPIRNPRFVQSPLHPIVRPLLDEQTVPSPTPATNAIANAAASITTPPDNYPVSDAEP